MNRLADQRYGTWGLVALVVSVSSLVQAEDVTVTTYYPSPRGNYQEVNTMGPTSLATTSGNAVIGGPLNTGLGPKLVVLGTVRIAGSAPPLAGSLLATTDTLGSADWRDPATLGFVTGSGTLDFIPRWTTGSTLGNSVIQQNSGNIGIGGGLSITGTLTLPGLPAFCPAGTTKLFVSPLGVVSCGTDQVNDADNVIGNELTWITAGAGIAVTGILPSPTVALANPIKTCTTPGEFMTSFNLGAVGAPTCAPPPGAGGGFTGTLSTIDPDVTLSPNPWDPDTGINATISVAAAASPLPTGSNGQTLRNSGGGTNWVADSNLFNNGINVGIGTSIPGQKLDVSGNINASGNMNIGALSTYQRGGTPGVSTTCTLGNTPSGITLSGGIITSAGACTAIGGAGVLPGGTTGQTLRHNGISWIADSNLFNTGINVGIGTGSPGGKLSVVGQATFGSTSFAPPGGEPISTAGGGSGISFSDRVLGDPPRWVIYPQSNVLNFWQSGVNRMTLNSAGRADIQSDLWVAGQQVCRAGAVIPGCGGGGPGTGTLTGGANITLSPNPWDPDSGINATISAVVGGGTVTAGSGLTGGGALPTTLNVGAGTGISVGLDTVGLTNPTKTCGVGNAIRAFDLGSGLGPTCEPITGVGGSVGPGTANFVAKFNAAGTNVQNSSIFDNGSSVGIRMTPSLGGTLEVLAPVRLGAPSFDSWFPFTDNNAYVTGANIIFRNGAPGGWAEAARINTSAGTIRGATYGFGGMYVTQGLATCINPNPFTGGCNCPAGFTARHLHWFFDPADSTQDGLWFCHK